MYKVNNCHILDLKIIKEMQRECIRSFTFSSSFPIQRSLTRCSISLARKGNRQVSLGGGATVLHFIMLLKLMFESKLLHLTTRYELHGPSVWGNQELVIRVQESPYEEFPNVAADPKIQEPLE